MKVSSPLLSPSSPPLPFTSLESLDQGEEEEDGQFLPMSWWAAGAVDPAGSTAPAFKGNQRKSPWLLQPAVGNVTLWRWDEESHREGGGRSRSPPAASHRRSKNIAFSRQDHRIGTERGLSITWTRSEWTTPGCVRFVPICLAVYTLPEVGVHGLQWKVHGSNG